MPTPGLRGRLPAKLSQLPFIHNYMLTAPVPVTYPYDISGGLTAFPMYGNGTDGSLTVHGGVPVMDCIWAGRQNDRRIKAVNYGLAWNGESTDDLVTEYLAYNGGKDLGGCMADVLHAWFTAGQIAAYGRIDISDPAAIDRAAIAFHGVLVGVDLTNDADTLTSKGEAWTLANGETLEDNGGHVLVKIASDGTTYDKYISWEFIQVATPAWSKKCIEEAWVIVTPEDAGQLDMPTLLVDINTYGGTS
jgi:hypothetical protein